MRTRAERALKWIATALVIVAVGAALVQVPTAAQDHGGNGPNIIPTGSATLTGRIRTAADMRAADAALTAAGPAPRQVKRFMPTDPVGFAAAKSRSRSGASAPRDPAGATAEAAVTPLAPPTAQFINREGLAGPESGGFAPSDAHGAAGNTQYAQIVNTAMRVYTKGVTGTSQPAIVSTVTLKALFGLPSSAETLFDPRIVYDPAWDRWVVVATRRNASPADTVKKFYLAVSTTSLASGTWCTYDVNFSGGLVSDGDWWDYPQLGMDLDGLIVTGNIFTSDGLYRTTSVVAIPKAQAYNCLALSVPRFEVLIASLAPPLVRDTNGNAFLVAARFGDSNVHKYTLTNSSRSTVALAGPVPIAGVLQFFVPEDAPQPGTTVRLDTLDARFVNASTQIGSDLWNVHAVATAPGGIAILRWYRINTTANNVTTTPVAGGEIIRQRSIASGSNYLFNASIAANDVHAAVVTMTLSSATRRAQMRFTGKENLDRSMGVGTVVATSRSVFSFENPARWGDYSAVSVDPVNTNHFWLVNQLSEGPGHGAWRTRIARVGY